jgi:hypothetical protein
VDTTSDEILLAALNRSGFPYQGRVEAALAAAQRLPRPAAPSDSCVTTPQLTSHRLPSVPHTRVAARRLTVPRCRADSSPTLLASLSHANRASALPLAIAPTLSSNPNPPHDVPIARTSVPRCRQGFVQRAFT